jgi:2-amino-4-hydroxy-6-hydroxymethyldihydropteridine diphosphokinase
VTPFKFRYLIALGSNTGERQKMLKDAANAIEKSIGPIVEQAAIYETEPIGVADSLFLNSALTAESNLSPQVVMTELLAIEQNLGRIRTEKWGNRTIDLDILLCEEKAAVSSWKQILIESPTLTLPHPEMLKRSFVMLPAIDVARDWVHPVVQLKLGDAFKKYLSSKELESAKRLSEPRH